MNLDNAPLLVCPKPVRLASTNWLTRATAVRSDKVVTDENAPLSDSSHSPSPSPRMSPRSPLSNEAMDEFLSILKPSLPAFFPPSSPILRSYMPNAMPNFSHERSRSLKLASLDISKEINGSAAAIDEDPNSIRSATPSRSSNRSDIEPGSEDSSTSNMMSMAADITGRWFRSAILSSPISRTNGARNPLTKHVNQNRALTPRPLTPLSPANIPLPPTPDLSSKAEP